MTRIDAIKIDVDSFDFEVLQGAEETVRRFDPFIMCEINPGALSKRNIKPGEVFDYLRKRHGYASYRCYDKENFLFKKEPYFMRTEDHPLLPTAWPDGETETTEGLGRRLAKSVPAVNWEDAKNMPPVPDKNRDTLDDAPCLRYLFRNFKPSRHLEFGTWKGEGVLRVLEECGAHVWTLNLYEGETAKDGGWAYLEKMAQTRGRGIERKGLTVRTDAGGMIGRLYLEAGMGSRVDQIYADSREWDDGAYPDGFFDSVFVDGGHDAATSRSDLYKALRLLRPGGLLLLHDFCPDPEVNQKYSSTAGVTSMVLEEHERLISMCGDLFWIKGTWILCGIRRGAGDPDRNEEERKWFLEIKERTLENLRKERAKENNSQSKSQTDKKEPFGVVFHKEGSGLLEFMEWNYPKTDDVWDPHAATRFFPVPHCGGAPQNMKLILNFDNTTEIFLVQVQDAAYTVLAEFDLKQNGTVREFNFILCDDPGEIRLVFYVPKNGKDILANAPAEITVLSDAVSPDFLRGLTLITENELLRDAYESVFSSLWGKAGRKLGLLRKERL
jgi:predicted O-methyltransferase YrrM